MDTGVQLSPWQQMRLSAMAMRQAQAQEEARRQAGGVLYGMLGGGGAQPSPQMPPAIPQAPMLPAPQPGSMSPGGGNPQVMGGAQPPSPQAAMQARAGVQPMQLPNAGARPMAAPAPPIPPFRPMPTAPAANDQGGAATGIAPPPAAAAAPADTVGGQPHFDLKTIVGSLKQAGVKPERVMDMLDALSPAMSAQNKQELEGLKMQNAALTAAANAYRAYMTGAAATSRAGTAADEAARRRDQGDQNLQIKRDKEARLRAAAGNLNLKGVELIYPKGANGQPDMTQPPIGSRGTTKTGKIINLDAEGHQVPTLAGATAKEGKASSVNVKDTVRSNLVKGGVKNSLDRLTEIEKDLKGVTTSSFFGQHGDNPLTRKLYGTGKSTMDKKSQMADARWGSFIDEAIPVFTGGLRGSDAFRRFLIEQAPGPGDEKVWDEKVRLFKANINGTSKAFFNKFADDPNFWGPGVTKEQVQAARGGGDGGATAAPQQGEWKVEKVN